MPSRRCTDCVVSWPTEPSSRYHHCPLCGKATWWAASLEAITSAAAFDLLLDAEPPEDRAARLAKLEREDAARSEVLCFKARVRIVDGSSYNDRSGTIVDWIPDLGSDTPFLVRLFDNHTRKPEFGWWAAERLEPLRNPAQGYQ